MPSIISKKILIVSNDDSVRESLKLILNIFYNIILTNSVEQAIDCIKNDKSIALILLDIKIPKINSAEFLKSVKEINLNIKSLLVAGYHSDNFKEETSKAGANGYITKPFKSDEVLNTIAHLIK